MTKTILAALVLAVSVSGANAQSAMRVSSGSPGTVGAMEMVVQGIAASPQDVASQQEGRSTAAEGDRPLAGRNAVSTGATPGTVGATPGNDPMR